jgi:hypothetical protein
MHVTLYELEEYRHQNHFKTGVDVVWMVLRVQGKCLVLSS